MSSELCYYSTGFHFKICLRAREVSGPLEKQAPSYVGMKLGLTTHSWGYGPACDSILSVAFLLVCFLLNLNTTKHRLILRLKGGEKRSWTKRQSLFLSSGLMCILVRAMLWRPSVSTRSGRQCRHKSIDSHSLNEKYRDKTSRRVKMDWLWVDAFLAHRSCRRIFFK